VKLERVERPSWLLVASRSRHGRQRAATEFDSLIVERGTPDPGDQGGSTEDASLANPPLTRSAVGLSFKDMNPVVAILPVPANQSERFGVEFVWQNGDRVVRRTFPGTWSKREFNVIVDFASDRLRDRIKRGRPVEESDVAQLYRTASAAALGHDHIIP